jgi:hypothetical protein
MAGRGIRHPNFHALSVAMATLAVVHINTDPLPAGSDPLSVGEREIAIAAAPVMPRLILPPAAQIVQTPLGDGLDPAVLAIEGVPPAPPTATMDAAGVPMPVAAPVAAQPEVLTGKWAMQMNVVILQKGLAHFSHVPDYTATFTKQERIAGDLTDVQEISLKVRQKPFSVYMKWRSGKTGQQAIFVEGQNEGMMLVKPGGALGRLAKCIPVDPNGDLALSQARYPVTMAGLPAVAEMIMKYQQGFIEKGSGFQCEFRDDAEFDGRPCYRFFVVYDNAEVSPDYRKSEILVDKQLALPVYVKNYTWARDADPATLDEQTLVEHYTYTGIEIAPQFADLDFDRTNPEYRMTR